MKPEHEHNPDDRKVLDYSQASPRHWRRSAFRFLGLLACLYAILSLGFTEVIWDGQRTVRLNITVADTATGQPVVGQTVVLHKLTVKDELGVSLGQAKADAAGKLTITCTFAASGQTRFIWPLPVVNRWSAFGWRLKLVPSDYPSSSLDLASVQFNRTWWFGYSTTAPLIADVTIRIPTPRPSTQAS